MKSNSPHQVSLIPDPDIIGIGYPALREAFNAFLAECQKHLTKSDLNRAASELCVEQLTKETADFFCDAALYSRPDLGRKRRERAIDRIAKKVAKSRDPLVTFIAQALPKAAFSIFELKAVNPDGSVELHDLLERREIQVMDNALATNGKPGLLFAARFIELGPWHLGFGIVIPLRKSETLALLITFPVDDDIGESQEALSQLVYTSRIHKLDLVRTALDPMIDLLVERIEQTPSDISQLSAKFASFLRAAE